MSMTKRVETATNSAKSYYPWIINFARKLILIKHKLDALELWNDRFDGNLGTLGAHSNIWIFERVYSTKTFLRCRHTYYCVTSTIRNILISVNKVSTTFDRATLRVHSIKYVIEILCTAHINDPSVRRFYHGCKSNLISFFFFF